MDVGTINIPIEHRQDATAYMIPEQVRRLADLLLTAASDGTSA